MIVQKIVQAVLGERPRGSSPLDFGGRIEETGKLDADSALGYLKKLVEAGPADEDLPRAEAISVLILAQPEAAAALDIEVVEAICQTATALDESGEGKDALALLEAAFLAQGESPTLLRALETMRMQQRRQQREVSELVAAAEQAVNRKERSRARELIEQLCELDPKHIAIAKLESRIEGQKELGRQVATQRLGLLVGLAVVAGIGWLGFAYERSARGAYEKLPAADMDLLDSVAQRLDGLEGFVERYPVWTGSLAALEERAELRVAVLALEGREVEAIQATEAEVQAQVREADFAWREGKRLFDSGDAEGAIAEMNRALELGGSDWERAERVLSDIEAIRTTINPMESR